MSIEETIKLAIENGFEATKFQLDNWEGCVLDPLFWQALGRGLGWEEKKFYQYEPSHSFMGEEMPEAKWYFRYFMNWIWDGKDIHSFFKNL